MKNVILILLLLQTSMFSQEKFKKIIDEKKNLPMLIGVCERSVFSDSSFEKWWNEEYEYYAVDTVSLISVKNEVDEVSIKIVMGTWCSDSRREIPHLFKIFDYLHFTPQKYEIIAVDRNKKALTDISNLHIDLVPTIIIYKNNNELGRIVETPKETLEIDLSQILNKN